MTQFRRFVIFAGMRTGSNLLEATLNGIRRVTCFGEAFNPYMMGWPDKDELRGVTMAERDADPMRLLAVLWDKPEHLPGFRYFHDHDPRVFDAIMQDRECAKIILTRNPLDSYVSTKIAWATNQWKLNETETPQPAAISFDGVEFREGLDAADAFMSRVLHGLQASGQAAFWLNYDDLRDADVMTGLLHWMGRTDLERVECATDQVPQNPRELSEKVENFDEMQAELVRIDPFQTGRIPTFEPRRGPAVPSVESIEAGRGVLFWPVRGGPSRVVRAWMEALGPVGGDFTQNSLRQWKRTHSGHRSFTVLRHPLRRAWAAFEVLLYGGNADLRDLMRRVHRVALPAEGEIIGLSETDQAALFEAFLAFLRRNLNGQTTLAVLPIWATQTEVLAGFSRFSPPDLVLREESLARDLRWLAQSAGIGETPEPVAEEMPGFLSDKALRKAAKAAYLRDYISFGFED